MKRLSLYFILFVFSSILFTSCEKDADDDRFVRIGEVRAIVNGKEFTSRSAEVVFKRYGLSVGVPYSAVVHCENVLGDRMTFNLGNALPGSYLLSELVDPEASLSEYFAVTYKETAENGGDEFSSKRVFPSPDNKISVTGITPVVSSVDGSVVSAFSGEFSYTAGNVNEGVITVEDGSFEIILTKEEIEQYLELYDKYGDFDE